MLHIEKERRGNQKVSRAPVAGGRDVVEDREAQQRFDVDIVGLRLERIPEEYEQIDVAFGEHRADLRVAAEGTGEQTLDGKAGDFGDALAGRSGREELAAFQRFAVKSGPLAESILAFVVRNKRNPWL